MKVVSDGYLFDFPDALEAFVFDEKDKNNPNYHGMPMKAVDIVVEFADKYLYIEIKEYDDISEFDSLTATGEKAERSKRQERFRWLKNYLKYKYRDTFLYRYAEEKVEKPVIYLCLMNFDNVLNNHFSKELRKELPVGRKTNSRWKRELVAACHVVNLERWNKNFPWPASRL